MHRYIMAGMVGTLCWVYPVRAERPSAPPVFGVTLKGDVANSLMAPGLKAWLLPWLAVEGFYLDVLNEYEGFAVRALLLGGSATRGTASIRPYAGVGYAEVRQEVYAGSLRLLQADGVSGIDARGRVTASGSGMQVFAGVQIGPVAGISGLYFECELGHAFFDVEGRARLTAERSGSLSDFFSDTEVNVSSDYEATSLVVALTYYFF